MSVEEIILNRTNWLGSDEGLVLKSIYVPTTFATTVTENDRKIVKSGTIFTTPCYGLLLSDIDITDDAREASLVVKGSYIDGNLPVSASDYATTFKAQGLYDVAEGAVTRPKYNDLLDITKDVHTTVVVTRDGEELADNAIIYLNDVLTITVSYADGYKKNLLTVNGTDFTSGETFTVVDDTAIIATAVIKDSFTMNAKVATVATPPEAAANQAATTVEYADGNVNVSVDISALNSFASGVPAQGTGKWIGLLIDTGEDSIIGISYGEYPFATVDVDEATYRGGEAGEFLLWIKAEEVESTPKTFTLSKEGFFTKTITVNVTDVPVEVALFSYPDETWTYAEDEIFIKNYDGTLNLSSVDETPYNFDVSLDGVRSIYPGIISTTDGISVSADNIGEGSITIMQDMSFIGGELTAAVGQSLFIVDEQGTTPVILYSVTLAE